MNRLIDESTGKVNRDAFKEAVRGYAIKEWGGTDYPPRYLRKAQQWVRERCEAIQYNWRQDNQ